MQCNTGAPATTPGVARNMFRRFPLRSAHWFMAREFWRVKAAPWKKGESHGRDDLKMRVITTKAEAAAALKFLRGSADNSRQGGSLLWTVPWGVSKVVQVMVLWFTAFWMVGSWLLPTFAIAVLGLDIQGLGAREAAFYSLVTDVLEMLVGFSLLRTSLTEFRPLPRGWFPLYFSVIPSYIAADSQEDISVAAVEADKRQEKGIQQNNPSHQQLRPWPMDVLLGVACFPVVILACMANDLILSFGMPTKISFELFASSFQSDALTCVLYLGLVGVCAPIWEEVLFRGFFLASLTKWFPLWLSVVVSGLAFSLAHFSAAQFLPLWAIGIIMGIVFVRSRNLVASIILHSLWNVIVLAISP